LGGGGGRGPSRHFHTVNAFDTISHPFLNLHDVKEGRMMRMMVGWCVEEGMPGLDHRGQKAKTRRPTPIGGDGSVASYCQLQLLDYRIYTELSIVVSRTHGEPGHNSIVPSLWSGQWGWGEGGGGGRVRRGPN
jgi:hypothetical protein